MGKPVEKRGKGRPSLLDLQKRSFRLQKQEEEQQQQQIQNPNPSSRPFGAGHRNAIPDRAAETSEEENEENDEGSGGKRRDRKLKLVLRNPDQFENSSRDAPGCESEGNGSGPLRKRKIEEVGDHGNRSMAEKHSSSKATQPLQAEKSDSGTTTPLPDKKLLLFILDRLQKKDTYGVFSDPVDPEELPDYHEVVENPMDFATVRKKLSSGAYKYLEQFEKDVFLISSNAMCYNATDTIYYCQARSIQELAKKNFDNLRQEIENESETKTVLRSGRPRNKNIKRPVGRPPAERTASDFFSDITLVNATGGVNLCNRSQDFPNKSSAESKSGLCDMSARGSYSSHNFQLFGWIGMHEIDPNEEYSGSAKGIITKFGKKIKATDENRRSTHWKPDTCGHELPVLSLFDVEEKQLLAVGFHAEYSYAQSLARFAAQLGPVGWAIAAKEIEKSLPPGTKFGPGWVVYNENLSAPMISSSTSLSKGNNSPFKKLDPSPDADCKSPPSVSYLVESKENSSDNTIVCRTKTFFQPIANGFNTVRPMISPISFGSEQPMSHSRVLDMVSRNRINHSSFLIQTHGNHFDSEKMKLSGNSHTLSSSYHVQDHEHESWLLRSPLAGSKVDSQQPDLAL